VARIAPSASTLFASVTGSIQPPGNLHFRKEEEGGWMDFAVWIGCKKFNQAYLRRIFYSWICTRRIFNTSVEIGIK